MFAVRSAVPRLHPGAGAISVFIISNVFIWTEEGPSQLPLSEEIGQKETTLKTKNKPLLLPHSRLCWSSSLGFGGLQERVCDGSSRLMPEKPESCLNER